MQQQVDKSANALEKTPSDKNYLNLLKVELGSKHVVKVRQSTHKYSVAQIKGYTFKSEDNYYAFGKSIHHIMSYANKAGYVKSGLGFIQHGKDGNTDFTFAYDKSEISKGKPILNALKNGNDSLFESATSFYIEPFFKQDADNNIMTDSDVNAGPIVGPDKMALNTEIMETFDD